MPADYELSPALEKAYKRLLQIRKATDLSLKPCPFIQDEVEGLDGQLSPFTFRYYQVQGIFHLMVLHRIILGDGTGLGKTIEALGGLAYLWATIEPKNKVLVVAPKSAIRQWAGEITRFTKGVRPIIAGADKRKGETPVEARARSYQEWADAPTGPGDPKVMLILNYALLVQDWDHGGFQPLKPNGKPDPKKPVIPGLLDGVTQQVAKAGDLVALFDECLDYYTPVQLADGSTDLVGKIVCKRKPVEVLSWDWEHQRIEPRRVVHWFRKPVDKRRSLLKLSFRFSRSCRVTKSHRFYRPDGKAIRARDLKVGSETAHLCLNAPSEDQLQIVLGGLLGDASVHRSQRLWGVDFVHGEKQAEYLAFKREALTPLGVSEIGRGPSGYGGRDVLRFYLHVNAALCSNFTFHDGRRKSLSWEWLDAINPLGLAVWYADDGSLQESRCRDGSIARRILLNTQGFTAAEHQLLVGWLWWKWGVKAKIKPGEKGYTLYLPRAEAEKFLALLPGSFPGMGYKFPGKPPLNLDTQPRQRLVPDTVTAVVPWSRAPKKRDCRQYVYDLEVEGNHNYFAGGTLVSNCQAFKNIRTKTWEKARYLADRAHRVIGLTATLLKNHLFEGYCIYKVIKPDLFSTQTKFRDDYCFYEMKRVKGNRKIPIILGYKNLDHFRQQIDPFFLGRPKHVVSDELPTLTTREVVCELDRAEDVKYGEALTGLLELGDGDLKDFEETKALTSLIYCQQVVNSLSLLKYTEGQEVGAHGWDFDKMQWNTYKVGSLGSKEQALVDLLTGELDHEKVIIYTRFESLVGRLQKILTKEKIKSVRITGKEKDADRRKAQELFQKHDSGVQVVFITDAGSEAINLQAAAAMVFYDIPWSWGNYVQTLGRMIRIGSPHKGVLAFHLVAQRPAKKKKDRKTIDQYVLAGLRKKKNMIDKVLGEAAVGALKFDKQRTTIRSLVKAMQKGASV